MINWVLKFSLGLLKDNESIMWIIGMLIWDKNNKCVKEEEVEL